jgi:biopolymer transport protein ExbB/TolQ
MPEGEKRVIKGIIVTAFLIMTSAANASMSAAEIRTERERAEAENENLSQRMLSSEEKEKQQSLVDAEVTAHFKKRVQMRPSDVERIDPACDEWLKLYKVTGSKKAKEGISETCP